MLVVRFCFMVWVLIGSIYVNCTERKKVKKRDLERLYDQWIENDDDELEEDELPPYKRKTQQPDLDKIMKQAKTPEELMMLSKKGQSVMMFVGIGDVNGKRAEKFYTERWIGVWQNSLFNNHIDVQTFTIDDNRAIFMFADGSKAWEGKDFLLKQPQVSEVSLEGRQYPGPAFKKEKKEELYSISIFPEHVLMENSVDFEEWQLSKLDHFLAVTNIHDTEVALSLLKSLNWDMEKAIEEHLLDNTESLSMSSSGSDFIVIDSSLSNNEHIERSMDEPTIIYNTNWNTAIASLPDDNTRTATMKFQNLVLI
ncbi:Chaperone for wingless signaling and trafficking of LDL receptor family protein [Acanthocheilonema viteae]